MINERELELYSPDTTQYVVVSEVFGIENAHKVLLNNLNQFPNHPTIRGIPRLLTVEELCGARMKNPTLIDKCLLTGTTVWYEGDNFRFGDTNGFGLEWKRQHWRNMSIENMLHAPWLKEVYGIHHQAYITWGQQFAQEGEYLFLGNMTFPHVTMPGFNPLVLHSNIANPGGAVVMIR